MDAQKLPRLVDSNINTDFIWPTIKRAGYAVDEDGLLQAIHDESSKKLVHYAVIALNRLGTTKSIPVLKELLYYPSDDVRTTAITTIGKIAGPKETKFYASLLDDPKYKDKDYAMAVIREVGTGAALPAVTNYAKKILEGRVKILEPLTDYGYIIGYMERFPSEEVDGVLSRLREKAKEHPMPKIMSKEALEKFKKERNNSN